METTKFYRCDPKTGKPVSRGVWPLPATEPQTEKKALIPKYRNMNNKQEKV